MKTEHLFSILLCFIFAFHVYEQFWKKLKKKTKTPQNEQFSTVRTENLFKVGLNHIKNENHPYNVIGEFQYNARIQ